MREARWSDEVRRPEAGRCRVAVVWIDWYAYHVARFRGLMETPELRGQVAGIELVGGVGVHAGLKFREPLPPELPVITLEPNGNWAESSKTRLSTRLWHALSALDPDVVLVPGYYTLPGLTAAVWARFYGRTPVLMSESTAEDHPRTGGREFAKSLLLRALFDWAVVGGTAHRRYLTQLRFPSDRVVGCYDVVDNDVIARETARARQQTAASEQRPYFLFVGRLAPEKNVCGLVEAWLRYRESGGDWRLVLAGDGPERRPLEKQIAASGLSHEVTLTGLRTSEELLPIYAAAGCFVLPSLREPWGLVVNEAMAASLPVLVSARCGCAADLVEEGRNGFTFDPVSRAGGDAWPQELTARMEQIAAMPASLRRQMGARSAALLAPLSPQSFGMEIASITADPQTSSDLAHRRLARIGSV